MSARSAMTNRATVERATRVTDDFGQPGPHMWSTHLASLPCRWWVEIERSIMDGQKEIVFTDLKIIVPLGTDILEADRVTAIKDRTGTSLVGNIMRIDGVVRRRDHKEVRLVELA